MRSSEEITKILANHIFLKISNGVKDFQKYWIHINNITGEVKKKFEDFLGKPILLKELFIFGPVYHYEYVVNIPVDGPYIDRCVTLTKDKLIDLLCIAILYKIPICDIQENEGLNYNQFDYISK